MNQFVSIRRKVWCLCTGNRSSGFRWNPGKRMWESWVKEETQKCGNQWATPSLDFSLEGPQFPGKTAGDFIKFEEWKKKWLLQAKWKYLNAAKFMRKDSSITNSHLQWCLSSTHYYCFKNLWLQSLIVKLASLTVLRSHIIGSKRHPVHFKWAVNTLGCIYSDS